MEHKALVKNLLLSFLPILMFVGADEYLSGHFPEHEATQYALGLGTAMGIVQATYVLLKEKRIDKLVLLDTGLLIAMGWVSLASGSDIFFKVKPALVQGVMVIALGVMTLKPHLLAEMSGRFLPGKVFQENEIIALQRSARIMVLGLSIHTTLIVYAAFAMSRAAWAFISGPLLYIVVGGYFGTVIMIRTFQTRYGKKR